MPIRRLAMIAPISALATCLLAPAAFAGPPFLTDDPEPTPHHQYEIYLFASGVSGRDETDADAGLDFNYGAGEDLQLSATLPISYEHAKGSRATTGLGSIELAAKYRIAHQESFGLDVAVFPRVFLPAGSNLGDDHASLLLPIWVGRDGEAWSAFGGGGCALNRGGGSRDYCIAGVAGTQRFGKLQAGVEVFHQTPDAEGDAAATILGLGLTYDISARLHVLSYAGAQMQNTAENGRALGYASMLFTF